MYNNTTFTENDVIKKAILMLKENLSDIKNYINNPASSTLKLQKIKVEILKADDRLNDIYNVLNANDETKLMEAKKLCNILQEEARAILEEKKYNTLMFKFGESSKFYSSKSNQNNSDLINREKYEYVLLEDDAKNDEIMAQALAYEEQREKEKKIEEKKIAGERKQDEKLYGKEYAIWHSLTKLTKLYGNGPYGKTVKELEDDIKHYGDTTYGLSRREIIKEKNYCKYFIKAYKPDLCLDNVSKRKLPAEIFKYLFSNGYLKEENIVEYSTNQFGRNFEAKRGDIQTEKDMMNNQKNLHRYNKIDFSKIDNSKYNRILYISNQWDYDSITKFVDHINEKFKGIIFAEEERCKKSVYRIEN